MPAMTEEEARAQAKALLAGDAPDDAPVSREAAQGEQKLGVTPAVPADTASDHFDAIVRKYTTDAAPAAPAEPVVDPAIAEAKRHGLAPPEAPGAPEAPSQPFSLTGLVAPQELAASGDKGQVAAADDEAARRAEFKKLDPRVQQAADARLAQPNQGGVVVVSPGGMRPSSDTQQVTQGPQVPGGEELLQDEFKRGHAGTQGEAAPGMKRDTTPAGLESNYAQGEAKLAGAEKTAQTSQTEALTGTPEQHGLGGVSGRIDAALKAAAAPVESPVDEISKMGIGQKIAFALASAGSTYFNRDIYGGPKGNPFLDNYNQQINARVAQQERDHAKLKDNVAGQENLFGVMKQGFQSDDAARTALRLMYAQAFKTKLDETAAHYNIDAANPHLLQMQAQIDGQILAQKEELAKISGKHISEEQTQKYVPPSAVVVGGPDAKEREKSIDLDKRLRERGVDKSEADLDTLNSVVGALDKNGHIARYAAEHGQSTLGAYYAMSQDPAQRQFIVDVQRGLKTEVTGNAMRSDTGRDIAKTLGNPNESAEVYNRIAHEHAKAVAETIAASGDPEDFQRYLRNRRRAQDIQHTTNSPVRAQGAEPLPDALPQVQ